MITQLVIGRGQGAALPGAQQLHERIESVVGGVDLRVTDEHMGVVVRGAPQTQRCLQLRLGKGAVPAEGRLLRVFKVLFDFVHGLVDAADIPQRYRQQQNQQCRGPGFPLHQPISFLAT